MNNRLRNARKRVDDGSYPKNSNAYDHNRLSKSRLCFAIRTTVPIFVFFYDPEYAQTVGGFRKRSFIPLDSIV